MSDEKFWADLRKKNEALFGPLLTPEEMAEKQRESDARNKFAKKYPDRDGAEFAILQENGEIYVHYHQNSKDGSHGSGYRTYSPGDKDYQAMWDRHQLNDPKGTIHVIATKWDEQNSQFIDLGDDWIA